MTAQPLSANQLVDLAALMEEKAWEETGAPALQHLLELDRESCPLPVSELPSNLYFAAARREAAKLWPGLVERPEAERAAQVAAIEGRSLWGVVEAIISHAVELSAQGHTDQGLAAARLAEEAVERLPLAPPWITDPYRKEARDLARLAEAHAHLCRHDSQHARERLVGVPTLQRSPLGALVMALYEMQRSAFKTAPYQCCAEALRFTKDQPLLWIYRAVARLAVQPDLTERSLEDVAEALELLRTRPHPQALNLARGLRADLLSQRPTAWTEKARLAVQELEGGEDKHPWFLARLEDDPDLYLRAYQLHQADADPRDGQAAVIAAEHALCLLRRSGQAETLINLARAVAEDLADKIPQQLMHAFQLLEHPQFHTLAVGTRLLTMARSKYYRALLYRLPAGPVRIAG